MKFVGRKEELAKLKKNLDCKGFSFALIYGRRRIGKSELVKQAIKNTKVKCMYYECRQVTAKSNALSLGEVVSETMGLPRLGYTDVSELLAYIFELSKNESLVLVLDEYPYLRDSLRGIDSILQSLVDKYKNTSRLKLIILGSYVDVMKSLLGHSNPLYGRVDLTINLKQMDYYESSAFYPHFSYEDRVRMYSVLGGIPYYNSLVDDRKSVRQNIIDLVASTGARLENEVAMYLNAEISKIANANEVFEALSRGYSRYSDILSQSHVSSSPTLADVLDRLMRMEVVVKIAPINEPESKKKSGYYICDNLSLFYYRYIYRYASQMNIMDPKVFYKKYIEKNFEESFVPHIFENICTQYLIRQNKVGKISPVFEKIGKYYYDDATNHTNGEFDIVTEDEKGYVFYEAKFRKSPVTESMIKKELAQVAQCGLECYKHVFISRSGFDCKAIRGVKMIGLAQLYLGESRKPN